MNLAAVAAAPAQSAFTHTQSQYAAQLALTVGRYTVLTLLGRR